MKKLMFAAVAGLGLSAFAAIESSNVVGYQGKALKGNNYFTFVVPTFNVVDTNATMKLKDIKLAYDGDGASDQNIWTLTLGGATKKAYYYVNEEAAATEEVAVGWYEDTGFSIPADEVEIPYGQGFALVAPSADTKVVFSGAVHKGDAPVGVAGGGVFTFTGNCLPKDCTLADIALVYDGDGASDQNIWTLTNGGATKKAYYYVNEDAADTEEVEVGWYEDTGFSIPANDVELAAGDGIAVVAGSAVTFRVGKVINE